MNDRDYFAECGVPAWTNGYHAIPVKPAEKKITWWRWTVWCHRRPREVQVARWATKYRGYSVGIACGASVVAIDIDEDEGVRADALQKMAELFLGQTPLVRFGRAPRRVLVYRVVGDTPILSRDFDADQARVQILGAGRQFVAFGLHPTTGQPYRWVNHSPTTLPLSELPSVRPDQVERYIRALELLSEQDDARPSNWTVTANDHPPRRPLQPFRAWPWRIEGGLVTDGRDSYLTHLVWREARSGLTDAQAIARMAWASFEQAAELKRGRRNSSRPWSSSDALIKARALVANRKAHTALANGEKGALTYLRHRAVAAQAAGQEDAFWTPATKQAFALSVLRATAKRQLSPAALKVSEHMLGLVYDGGACFASAATLAEATGLAEDSVKRAKRELRQQGFWTTHLDRGGKGYIACSTPNPAMIAGEPDCEEASAEPQTVAISDIMITQRSVGLGGKDQPDFSDLVADPPRPQDERPFLGFE
ncbi:bifunctional DNA primase/polymerase [Methylobacterium sp. J-030]|uniref:bifunctional DNA primase/polymerase n=1 Tax=Methylobacterium sp. J-030 TaxID=2836627 RepID=UPI001FB8ED48|nr:bifunctional DNA primase/polymerase [Methylobacterium sp. J-030]MCJ2072968.1 bifunctional DNA primase/polymerase [Methylobacterium sp. J-030]